MGSPGDCARADVASPADYARTDVGSSTDCAKGSPANHAVQQTLLCMPSRMDQPASNSSNHAGLSVPRPVHVSFV